MLFAYRVEYWLFYALQIVAFGIEVWAFMDVVRRGAPQFQRAGQRDKSFWMLLTGVAAVVGLVGVLIGGGGFGLFSLAAVCVSAVYLAGPRGELQFYGGR